MLIYSEICNERFRYAVRHVLRHYPGEIRYTTSREEALSADGPVMTYADEAFHPAAFHVAACAWIWRNGIEKQLPELTEVNGLLIPDLRGDGRPDIFGTVFFFLSRYEEYVIRERDHHDRFVAAHAWQADSNWMDRPLVDAWIDRFMQDVEAFFPHIKFERPKFSLTASIDVDSAFAYRYKGFKRSLGGAVKDLLALDFSNLMRRVKAWAGLAADPYDTYDYILETCAAQGIPLIWFFLLADHTREDVNVSHKSKKLRELIRRLAAEHLSGIHPGYASNSEHERLAMEIRRLEEITGKGVIRSRQHYLKMEMPKTYRRLIAEGITEDYTMGYFDRAGFRAGTAHPFDWFDLEKNESTTLKIFPFQAMDTTLQRYQKLDPASAKEKVSELMNNARIHGGHFMILWHNESLSETGRWKGWREVWEHILLEGNRLRS